MNILIIGSGGREHTLAWKIKQSSKCTNLYVAPGNAGTDNIATNLSMDVLDFNAIKEAIKINDISMVVVGPEIPLVAGLTDFLKADNSNVMVIGPDKLGATLEGSKDFSKGFMNKYDIPTAKSNTYTVDQLEEGYAFLATLKPPYVLKADGLAAGKGVIISPSLEEAKYTLKEMLASRKFGTASEKVVIEEFLDGIELSVFVITDGVSYKILPEAKDYKRIGENDEGPNTGGMGAVSPVGFAQGDFLRKVEERVVKPTVAGFEKEGMDYKGFVFIGLMNVKGEPYVIEYNVRMGDPETQVVMPRIKSDLVELFEATAKGHLSSYNFELDSRTATTVVMVAGGYPDGYNKGDEIHGIEKVQDALVFHAGTKKEGSKMKTNGGRVLAVTGLGNDIKEALANSYKGVDNISWKDCNFRKDIGKDLIALDNNA